MNEFPMKMYMHSGADIVREYTPGAVDVLVYRADAAPQPVAHVSIEADGSETHGPLLRSLPPGEYDLYTAPLDADAIRQSVAPQPVGGITVRNQQVVSASNVMLCASVQLPDGKYGLYTAPLDESAIRQSERARVAKYLAVSGYEWTASAIRRGEMT